MSLVIQRAAHRVMQSDESSVDRRCRRGCAGAQASLARMLFAK